MNDFKVAIIDDEKDSREIIQHYLKEHFPTIEVIGEAFSVQSGIKLLSSVKVNLIFLDIQLKNELSFDIIKHFDDINFNIIFITAYDEYAIKAIKLQAFDYILKPINRNEFIDSVNKVIPKIETSNISQAIDSIVSELNHNKNNQIKLPTLSGFKIINIKDIIRLQSEGGYTHVFLNNKESILVSQNLKIYENILNSKLFCRIHNSHIVNIDYIKEYIRGRGGQIILNDNTILAVSQKRKEKLLAIWK